MATKTMKPFNLYVPITRAERTADGLEIAGYAYCNAQCGDGYNLTRGAMEAAVEDYMRFGALREMHERKAAGTAISVEFDDKGAFFRGLVVDKDAIEKCEKKVYKGLSVGIKPQVMRGKEVVSCIWPEVSLVDRPADPDAVFNLVRADGVDLTAEYEVEVLEEEPAPVERVDDPVVEPETPAEEPDAERGMTSADAPARENLEGHVKAVTHYTCGYGMGRADEGTDMALTGNPTPGDYCHGHTTRGGAQECSDRMQSANDAELKAVLAYHQGMIDQLKARVETADDAGEPEILAEENAERTDEPALLRAECDAAITRAKAAETELARVQGEVSSLTDERAALEEKHATAIERIAVLEAEPANPRPRPVKYPEALERTFAANLSRGEQDELTGTLREQYETLKATLQTEPDQAKRTDGVLRLMNLKTTLAGMGVAVS